MDSLTEERDAEADANSRRPLNKCHGRTPAAAPSQALRVAGAMTTFNPDQSWSRVVIQQPQSQR